jgi:hypothetical protein
MLIPLLKEFWKQILGLLVAIIALVYIGFSIYNLGYQSCHAEWDKATDARNLVIANQTEEIKRLTKEVIDSRDIVIQNSNEHLTTILLSVKNKPMYKVDAQGKCVPSTDFENAYIDIIKGKK